MSKKKNKKQLDTVVKTYEDTYKDWKRLIGASEEEIGFRYFQKKYYKPSSWDCWDKLIGKTEKTLQYYDEATDQWLDIPTRTEHEVVPKL